MNKFFSILAMLFLLLTIVLLWITQGTEDKSLVAVSGEETVTEDKTGAVIGGGFSLTDHKGQMCTEQDYKGKVMLVFFGFTHCPDICPVTVSTFSSLMELLADKGDQVAPIFITVDPERDTPEVMKEYLSNFDKRIIGLTGTEDQIKKVAKAYKAYYARSSQTPPTDEAADEYGESLSFEYEDYAAPDDGNYLMDHSGYIYLMDKEGKYVEHFKYDVSEQELADALKRHLE